MDVNERGTWQLCHVKGLAFPFNISFCLMQHTPLWSSQFRILRIKKTPTKIGTLRISHIRSNLHRDIPSGSFTKTNLRKIGAINVSVKCKSGQWRVADQVSFYTRRTTTIFGISGHIKLVTLYCHAIFWGTEGLGEGCVKVMQVVSFLQLMANLFIFFFFHNGGI